MSMIVLNGFPMPPSANALHKPIGGRSIKSRTYRLYDDAVNAWCLVNGRNLFKPRTDLLAKMLLNPKMRLCIQATFHFERSRIYCKDDQVKQNDTSNRLKALHDAVARALRIDDKYFWSGSFDKNDVDSNADECVTVKIGEHHDDMLDLSQMFI